MFVFITAATYGDEKELTSVLSTSREPSELETALLTLAESREAYAVSLLERFLEEAEFLERLDSKDSYLYKPQDLRIKRVLLAVAKNRGQEAEELFLKLSRNKQFVAEPERLDGLVDNCAWLEDPSDRIFKFLDSHSSPTSGTATLVMRSLARIGSVEACRLLLKYVQSPEYQEPIKIEWFTTYVLTVRNNPNVVGLYEKVVALRVKSPEFNNTIVQTLYDYRPQKWYPPVRRGYPTPPPREEASTEVLHQLLDLAEKALSLPVSEDTRQSVRAAVAEIRGILERRNEDVSTGTVEEAVEPPPEEEPSEEEPTEDGLEKPGSLWVILGLVVTLGLVAAGLWYWRVRRSASE